MKNKDIKRILTIGLITVMCAAVTACGQASGSGNTSETVVSESTADGNASNNNEAEGKDGALSEGADGQAPGNPPDGQPGGGFGGGSSSADIDYSAAVEVTSAETQKDKTYSSTSADESALLVSTSDAVTITNPTVTKTGDSDGGDNCNFYGLNAALLVMGG